MPVSIPAFLLVTQFAVALFAATPAPPATDVRQRLEATVEFLASDVLRGRGTPSAELDIAAAYLASQLKSAGWKPGAGQDYLQRYELRSLDPVDARYELRIDQQRISPGDFIVIPYGVDPLRSPLRGEAVFANHGIDWPEQNLTDYDGLQLKNKVAVIRTGNTSGTTSGSASSPDRFAGKLMASTTRGSVLTLLVTPEVRSATGTEQARGEAALLRSMSRSTYAYLPATPITSAFGPLVAITPQVFDRTLRKAAGVSFEQWKRSGAIPRANTSVEVELRTTASTKSGKASNVVAMLPGSDPALRDEWIVLSAHYDHLGAVAGTDGSEVVYNGADDNASGAAALLEIARRLGALSPLRRSVMILLVSGEERGLLGSAYYASRPLVPMKRVVANINVDMIGRSNGSVQAIATNSEALFEKAREAGQASGIRVLGDQQPAMRVAYLTDSYHFSRFDVPAVEFFTGLHSDYHQPGDDAPEVRYEELTRITEAILRLTEFYARGGKAPAVRRPAWFVAR